jgi:hypothetical protein
MINMGLLKAAFYKPQLLDCDIPVLPVSSLCQEIQINATHYDRYNKIVNWEPGLVSVIHPNYLQVLTIPMQIEMMVNKPFPFKPVGLVHLANHIEVNWLPVKNAKLMLKTSFNGLIWHKKGWVFAVLSEGFVNGKLAVSGTSYYLSRRTHVQGHDSQAVDHDINPVELYSMAQHAQKQPSVIPVVNAVASGFDNTCELNFPVDVGRKYAGVSGDFNPIHLTRWTAKLMGFRKAIAHGMYSKALCLSLVVKQERQNSKWVLAQTPMRFSTQFMQAIYLPTRCELRVSRELNLINFSLNSQSGSKEKEHLRTNIVIG